MAPPTYFEWDAIRPIFEDLYVKRKLKLKVVKEILEIEHGFHASTRMYKTRIRTWHCDKNSKKSEMIAVIRKNNERAIQGEMPQFSIRGRRVNVEDAYRYFARKGRQPDELDTANYEDDAVTPKDLRCITLVPEIERPNHSHSPTTAWTQPVDNLHANIEQKLTERQFITPTAPQFYLTQQPSTPPADIPFANFLQSIQTYYSHKFHSSDWILGTITLDLPSLYPSMQFGSLFMEYHDLRTLNNGPAAFASLDKAFGMVESLLQIQDPRLLTYLLESLCYIQSVGYTALARQLIWYFTASAIKVLGRAHPLAVFGYGLYTSSSSALSEVIERGLSSMIEQFVEHIGAQHLETMRLLLTGSTIMKHQKSYGAAFRYLDQLLPIYAQAYGARSYQTCHALVDKAYLLLEQDDIVAAEPLVREAKYCAEGIADANEFYESNVRSLSCKAHLFRTQGKFGEVADVLETALSVGEVGLEAEHWMMRRARAELTDARRRVKSDKGQSFLL